MGKTTGKQNILLVFNRRASEILFDEDKVNDMESLAVFIYKQSIPNVHMNYTFRRMFDICDNYVKEQYINMNEIIYKEGEVSDDICILKEGQVGLFKQIPAANFKQTRKFQDYKVLTLEKGQVFGEDKMMFNCPNRFLARVTSIKAQVIKINFKIFQTQFRLVMKDMNKLLL